MQRNFNKALQEFSTTVGQELLPVITPLLQGASELLMLFGKLPKPVRTVAVAVAALGTAALVAAPAVAAIVTAFKAVGVVAVIAGAKIALVVAAVVGIGAALIALQDKWEPFRRATAAVAAFSGVVDSLKEQFAGTTKSWSDNSKKFSEFFVGIWNAIAGFFKSVGDKLQGIWNGVTGFFNEKLGFVVDFFEGIWNGITRFFAGIVNQLTSQWQTFVEFVVNSLVPLGNVFKVFGVNIGEAVANGLSSGFKALSAPQLKVNRPSTSVSGSGSGSG